MNSARAMPNILESDSLWKKAHSFTLCKPIEQACCRKSHFSDAATMRVLPKRHPRNVWHDRGGPSNFSNAFGFGTPHALGLGRHCHGFRMVEPVRGLVYRAGRWRSKQSLAVDFVDSNIGGCCVRLCVAGLPRRRSSSTQTAQVGRFGVRRVGGWRRGAGRF